MFPSPCGVWVVSKPCLVQPMGDCFRPLAGCGLFPLHVAERDMRHSFRPLAGCGLFRYEMSDDEKCLQKFPSPCGVWVVSVMTAVPC